MKILFAGTTAQAAQVLSHLSTSVHQIVGVLTREDAPFGRKAVLTPSPVAGLASDLGLHVIKANRVDEAATEQIKLLDADLGLVIAYGALLRADSLSTPKRGWINLHYSLLPLYRGAAPVQHSILNGERETGVTIFKLDEGMDTGPILTQVQTQIQPDETSGELLARLTTIGISALDECLAQIDAGIAFFREQPKVGSIAAKISRADARINWDLDATTLENLVRAMNPEPMAWTLLDGQPMRIITGRASSDSESPGEEAGSVFISADRVLVRCGQGTSLHVTKLQPAGKSEMRAIDWYRGVNKLVVFGG